MYEWGKQKHLRKVLGSRKRYTVNIIKLKSGRWGRRQRRGVSCKKTNEKSVSRMRNNQSIVLILVVSQLRIKDDSQVFSLSSFLFSRLCKLVIHQHPVVLKVYQIIGLFRKPSKEFPSYSEWDPKYIGFLHHPHTQPNSAWHIEHTNIRKKTLIWWKNTSWLFNHSLASGHVGCFQYFFIV